MFFLSVQNKIRELNISDQQRCCVGFLNLEWFDLSDPVHILKWGRNRISGFGSLLLGIICPPFFFLS